MAHELEVTAKAEGALNKLLEAFEHPEELPAKMAKTYLNVGDRYCSRWSTRNQILVWLYGFSDAATASTWAQRGRSVLKDQMTNLHYILKPIIRKFPQTVEETDENGEPTGATKKVWVSYLAGFEHWGVYGIEQTEVTDAAKWEEFAPKGAQQFLDSLPWLAVADKWGLAVEATPGIHADGYYEHGKRIGLNASEMRVWAHEMVHAAEDRLGTLTKAPGQQPDNELVAELGACVLLTLAGMEHEVDPRGAWEYVNAYDKDPRKTAFVLLGRICRAVELVLTEAGQLKEVGHEKAA